MAKAFVLIETMVGRTREVVAGLEKVGGVATVAAVTGPYDIIATVEADTLNEIGNVVTQVIHPVGGISRTVTCLVV